MKTEFQHVLILLIRMLVLVMCLKSEIKISLKLLVAIFFKAQSLQHETTSVKHILYSGQGDFPITVVVGWMRFACGHLRLCMLWVCMEVEVSAFRPANYGGNHGPLFYEGSVEGMFALQASLGRSISVVTFTVFLLLFQIVSVCRLFIERFWFGFWFILLICAFVVINNICFTLHLMCFWYVLLLIVL